MKKVILALCFMVILGLASSAMAARVYSEWRGAEGASWNVTTNWLNGIVPVAVDTLNTQNVNYASAGFKGYGAAPGTIASPGITSGIVTTDQLTLGGSLGGRLTVDGGTVNISEYMTIGSNTAEIGTLEMKSGIISTGLFLANSSIFVGQSGKGTLNMTGGTINIRQNLSIADKYATAPTTSEGLVNLFGGTIYAADLLMNGGAADKSNMVITNGFLVLAGNKVDKITGTTGFATQGWITTTNPGGTVMAAYDLDGGTTTVWATPEPATICLFGLARWVYSAETRNKSSFKGTKTGRTESLPVSASLI